MAGALLYQPKQRWRFGMALGAAALIHCAAVAIAALHRDTLDEFSRRDEFPFIEVIPDQAIPGPTPPPDEVTAPTPIPNPTEQQIFHDDQSTPPPVRLRIDKPTPPITAPRQGLRSSSVGLSSARVIALSAPRPEYPYEARRSRITGSGVAAISVDVASGSVSNVVMEASTGSPVLDNAAVTAFRRWRFQPGTVSRLRTPITFTLTGAQY
ncbi:MAG: TonB family protein [Verrucomicrobiota bacterium]|nr:TonB family protein [Verrucomicrobiota bacterium]